MGLDIDSGCKTALKHPRDSFPAIYHFPGHFRPFCENLNFLAKIVILAILTYKEASSKTDSSGGEGVNCFENKSAP